MVLKAEELLAGGSLTYEIEVPGELLNPSPDTKQPDEKQTIILKPLAVKDIQIIVKASRDNNILTSALMIQQALVEPKLKIEQISSMPAGLVKFLIEKINQISGLSVNENGLAGLVQAPLAKACFILAKEFGWTPQQASEMTIGQILLYLEMVNESKK
ncbi:MAG: hypothetical protein ABH870_06310 [bacterium]